MLRKGLKLEEWVANVHGTGEIKALASAID
jgi:hypothetical protein